MRVCDAFWYPFLSDRLKNVILYDHKTVSTTENELLELHFMVKRFHMSLRDLDPEGIIRHEDVVGIRQIEYWYLQRETKDQKRQQARSRSRRR